MADRKSLPHRLPLSIDPAREIFFVTVCALPRGENHLTREPISTALLDSVAYRNETGIWWAHLFLLMPDHCHALLSFLPDRPGLPDTVRNWKRWTNRQLGIAWQRDFFNHRLRHDESAHEKAEYILANPMRAGLMKEGEDWPHLWMPEQGFLHITR